MGKLAVWIHDWSARGRPEYRPKEDVFLVDPDMEKEKERVSKLEEDLVIETMRQQGML
jgi:hypothetical protein